MPSAALGGSLPFSWDDSTITIGKQTVDDGALAFVYPDGGRLAGYMAVTPSAWWTRSSPTGSSG